MIGATGRQSRSESAALVRDVDQMPAGAPRARRGASTSARASDRAATVLIRAAGLLVIPITLLARWLSVMGMVGAWRAAPGAVAIMTWAGLRGGISVALALSLPESPGASGGHSTRNVIVAITYAVVVFSIIVQGLTVAPLVRHKLRQAGVAVSPPDERAAATT